MKQFLFVMILLSFAGPANAVFETVVEDFEHYDNLEDFHTAWVLNPASNLVSQTIEIMLNGHCMLLRNTSADPYYAQTKLTLDGAVHNEHGVNLVDPGYFMIKMTFAVPLNDGVPPWGTLGGSGGDVFLSMFDYWGQKVFGASYPGDVTPSGTGWPNGLVWEMNFNEFTAAGMNLENVEQITIGYDKTYYGTGALFIDDIILVGIPEPATLILLGLGSLGLIWKRK
jgi:hypothetical protein